MRNPRTRKVHLSRTNRRVLSLLLPFLIVHFAVITPVVEWWCPCPDDDPAWNCSCNCPKCVERRGGFMCYCHLKTNNHAQLQFESRREGASPGNAGIAKRVIGVPLGSLETLSCECTNHIKKISLDVKPFLTEKQIPAVRPVPVALVISRDDRWPPEAISCQPEVPG